ncbi:MAG TPA: GNAT family protein [Candidatus Cloacimonadota bacterium]|nr:GNAT family protein [Candidatus Cloacimonadota bacterium]
MRIYLRAFEPDDYLLTHSWRQNAQIANSIGGNRFFISKERERQWVQKRSTDDSSGIYLAICLKDSDQMIGYCSIISIDLRNQKADLGGTIIGDPNHWGKGYGKEAQLLMMEYCFDELPIHKVYGYALEEHEVTKRMMLSLGFHIDGVLRDEIFKNGVFKSYTIYSILRDEYMAIYQNPGLKD